MPKGAKEQDDFLVDGVIALDGGMNASVIPQLLPTNQVSFATNVTFRGGFAKNRPAVKRTLIDFLGDTDLQAAFEQAYFQGACVYQPDLALTGIACSIGGRQFLLTPSVNGDGTASIQELTIPNDPNPPSNQQAWLWQAENFLICNDGASLPFLYDGKTSRRSAGNTPVAQATVGLATVVPAQGANVSIQITGPYVGAAVGSPMSLNGASYTVAGWSTSSTTTGHQVTLKKIFGNQTTIAANANVYQDNAQYHAFVTNSIPLPLRLSASEIQQTFVPGFPLDESRLAPAKIGIVNLSSPWTLGVGQFIIIGNTTFWLNSIHNGGLTAHVLNYLLVNDPKYDSIISNGASAISAIVFQTQKPFGPLQPPAPKYTTQTVGVVQVAIASPSVGNQVTIDLKGPFTGDVGKNCFINNEEFEVVSSGTSGVLTYFLTLTNNDDTPGNPIAFGTKIFFAPHELPPGRMGAYGQGRNWMSLPDGRQFIASDIVGGPSGTQTYNRRDAVLNVTENSFLAGGGTFLVPGNIGDIRAMKFVATLDVSLGQGPLQVFTPSAVFSCQAPVDRFVWNTLQNPILTTALIGAGALSQNGTINVNSDVLFRSVDGIRSLIQARRDFKQWGNVPESREVEVILNSDDASLIQFESAAQFDNRMLLSVLPSSGPYGAYCQGLIALNLDPVSNLRGKAPAIYDGLWTGLNVVQLVSGTFNGVDRCFAVCYQTKYGRLELYELFSTGSDENYDNGTQPLTWSFETASLFNNSKIKPPLDLVELLDGEIFLKDIRGPVTVQSWFRPDYSACWTEWGSFTVCADNLDTTKPKQQRSRYGLGEPDVMKCDPTTDRPYRIGNNIQVRFQITGQCSFMGLKAKAKRGLDTEFAEVFCKPLCDILADPNQEGCVPCIEQGDCVRFDQDLIFYNLNRGFVYSNALLSFEVVNGGNKGTIFVPPGTVTWNNPYPPDPGNPLPPITLKCDNGGTTTKVLPANATEEQIAEIVNEMIKACAGSDAHNQPNPPNLPFQPEGPGLQKYSNEVVYFVHVCTSGSLTYSGTLPSWITLDVPNSRLVGAAGIFKDNTQPGANAIAQAALDNFGNQELLNGHLSCGPSCTTLPSSQTNQILPDLGGIAITDSGTRAMQNATDGLSVQRLRLFRTSDWTLLDTFATGNTLLYIPSIAWNENQLKFVAGGQNPGNDQVFIATIAADTISVTTLTLDAGLIRLPNRIVSEGDDAYVAGGAWVQKISLVSDSVTANADFTNGGTLDWQIQDAVFVGSQNRLYLLVSDFTNNIYVVYWLDTALNIVGSLNMPAIYGVNNGATTGSLVYSPDSDTLYVAATSINIITGAQTNAAWVFDPGTNTVTDTIVFDTSPSSANGINPFQGYYDPNGHQCYFPSNSNFPDGATAYIVCADNNAFVGKLDLGDATASLSASGVSRNVAGDGAIVSTNDGAQTTLRPFKP